MSENVGWARGAAKQGAARADYLKLQKR
jgi:hypothetical protein